MIANAGRSKLLENEDDIRHHIVCGDARSVLSTFPSQSVAAVVTSPPYWGMRNYGHELEIGREATLEEYVAELVATFEGVKRVLRDDGVVWLILGDTYTSGNRSYRASDKKLQSRAMTSRPRTPKGLKEKDLIGLPWRVALALQAAGWYLRTDIVWAKPNPMPESVTDRPHRSHEIIFLLSKSAKYFFDVGAFASPAGGSGAFSRSVWTIPVGSGRADHPAAFPLDLIYPCVVSSTTPGDVVLDPFAGSGSVGLACLRTGRRFAGIEIVPEFAASADHALKSLQKKNRLHLA